MKINLIITGIIVSSIGFGFFVTFAIIIASALPEYNYYNYNGFRIPGWLYSFAGFLIIAGSWLVSLGFRKEKQAEPFSDCSPT